MVKFYLDTNALISLSGCSYKELLELSKHIEANKIELFTSHVQIDEMDRRDASIYEKYEHALKKLKAFDVNISLVETNQAVIGISRIDMCKIGSDELGEIDSALRREIELCMGSKSKGKINLACDALIALSSLDHDYFITGDDCMFRSWNKIIEGNQQNRDKILKNYLIPKITHRKKPKGVFQAIVNPL